MVAGEEQQDEDWAMVPDDTQPSKSFSLSADQTVLTTVQTRDEDRWTPDNPMPSLNEYSSTLLELDFFKNRYIKELHPSICDLTKLQSLSLVRCENLRSLPDEIGKLANLRTLNLIDASEISQLPESIGNLKR